MSSFFDGTVKEYLSTEKSQDFFSAVVNSSVTDGTENRKMVRHGSVDGGDGPPGGGKGYSDPGADPGNLGGINYDRETKAAPAGVLRLLHRNYRRHFRAAERRGYQGVPEGLRPGSGRHFRRGNRSYDSKSRSR